DEDDRDVPAGLPGQLLARGPYTIRGYHQAPELDAQAFTRDGFFRSGDIARWTRDGSLVVVGRVKDQINRAGVSIDAADLELQVLEHPAVRHAAVVAVPDPYLGEATCAVLVTSPAAATIDAAQIIAFLRRYGTADHMIPDRIEFVGELPT